MATSRKHYTREQHETAVRMWADGATMNAIAEAIGRPMDSVVCHIRTYREEFPYRRPITTNDERDEMRSLRAKGMTYVEIARYLGVSDTTVRNHAGDGRTVCADTRATKTEG